MGNRPLGDERVVELLEGRVLPHHVFARQLLDLELPSV